MGYIVRFVMQTHILLHIIRGAMNQKGCEDARMRF